MPEARYLTIQQAMTRVERSRTTIEIWIDEDLPIYRFGTRTRFVREDELLAALRKRLATARGKHARHAAGA